MVKRTVAKLNSSGSPMDFNTCEGIPEPVEQAEPADAQIPAYPALQSTSRHQQTEN